MEEVCPSLTLQFSPWLECRVTGWIPRKGMPHAEDGDVTGKNEPGILWCLLVLLLEGLSHIAKKILMAVAKYRRFFLLQ